MIADAQPEEETNQKKIERGLHLIGELSCIIKELPDSDIEKLLGKGSIDDLLKAILDPSMAKDYPNYAEFFLQNRMRSTIIAQIRYAITQNYSLKGKGRNGKVGYVSPDIHQWFEDGIILLEGKNPFEGLIVLYRNGEVKYAIVGRDAKEGDELGPEDFIFIKEDEFGKYIKTIPSSQISDLERPIKELVELLNQNVSDESKYQELFEHFPWVLGAKYSVIQRHINLDDKNIPDFTGIRSTDGYRDVIELKPPTMKVFGKSGDFSAEFNRAWSQTERYLDFILRQRGYLQDKGMNFHNPKCYLILGWNLSEDEREMVSVKERMNPSIELLTYNDLLSFMQNTVTFIKDLRIDVDA
jgi:hypothetical protein